jgi:uncharacterized OsmC-like protein
MAVEKEELERNLVDYKTNVSQEMKMTLTLERDLIFQARTQKGYEIDFDAQMEWGCIPTESLLASAAACLAIDVVSFVRKMRAEVSGFRMEVRGVRNPGPPQYFKEMDMKIYIQGTGIDQRKMDRAIDLSREKYCSVFHTLRSDLKHSVHYEILEG